jgi:hypothetical protein
MNRRIRLGFVAFGGAAALALASLLPAACTVLTNDALPDDAGKFDGSAEASSASCGSCVAQSCTGAWAVCLTDATCRALHQCSSATACGPSCKEACFGSGDGGGSGDDGGDAGTDPLAAFRMFAACNDARTCTACSADCVSTCASGTPDTTPKGCAEPAGGDAGSDADVDAGDAGDAAAPAPVTADGCASCVASKCGDPKKTCAIGTECEAYLVCTHACGDAKCADDCGLQRASGKAAAEGLSSCARAACSAACGL